LQHTRKHLLQNFYKGVRLSAILSIGIILIVFISGTEIKQKRFLHLLIGAWIITHILISHSKKTVLISLLSNRFLVYIGKMSYGIYLYHVLYLYFGLRL
jgi:peptidoglycan/LPS O-acetylase OafA/YrhL